MKYTIVILLIGFLAFETAKSQQPSENYTIEGEVVTEDGTESVPFATITIENDSAKVLTRAATGANGRFSIKVKGNGQFNVIASAVGYGTSDKKTTFNSGSFSKNIGKFQLKEGVELKEVTIAAQKPLIKSEPDKLVYSVESDPEARTTTALEIFRKVPMLTIDNEDNVSLNGQSNYKVLINGKASSMMSNNFKDVIRSMPANSIKDIEIITNPSSKYEAEGVAGIINIITLKNKDNGYNGNVGANVDSYGSLGANSYIAAKVDKITFSANLYMNQYTQPKTEGTSLRENLLLDTLHFSNTFSDSKYKGKGGNLSFEFGYEIDTFNLISSSFWGFLGNGNNEMNSITEDRTRTNDLYRKYSNISNGTNNYGWMSGNIDYQRTFKRPDKSFTMSYKLENNPNSSSFENNVTGDLNYTSYRQLSDNKAGNINHTVQLDFYDPISKLHQYEAGVKYILRDNNSISDVMRWDYDKESWVEDPTRNNDLDYKQHILGGYAGYVFKLKKFSTKTGLRAEQTWNDGKFISQETTDFVNSYFNLIPYITLSYQVKPMSTFKVSYTQRLSRPGIWYLNPYVNDRDPMNISYGNPNLTSEVSHSFETSYGIFSPKFNLNMSGSAYFLNNAIENYTFIDSQGRRISTYDNIGTRQNYNLNFYGSYRPNAKFNFGGNARLGYTVVESKGDLVRQNEGASYSVSLNARHTLWKDAAAMIYGGLFSPYVMLQGKRSLYYYSSISLTQQLLNKKLDLSLGISDPFPRKKYMTSEFRDPTFISTSENFQWGQRVYFRIAYRFGKMNIQTKKARRGINNDDMKSDSSGGGQSSGQQ